MRNDLDDALDASAPVLADVSGPELSGALADLVARSRRNAQPPRRRHRVVVGATAALIAIGGTAAAATAIGGWRTPWASEPEGVMTFVLPSGTRCEERIGDLQVGDPAADAMIHDWLTAHSLGEIADVDAALAAIRADDQVWHREDGTRVEVGYGTAYYDADTEYVDAVTRAIVTAVTGKLVEEGFPADVDYRWGGETRCEGGVDPTIPDYQR